MVSHNTMRIGSMICHRVARPEGPELQQSEATVAAMLSSPSRLGREIGEKMRRQLYGFTKLMCNGRKARSWPRDLLHIPEPGIESTDIED